MARHLTHKLRIKKPTKLLARDRTRAKGDKLSKNKVNLEACFKEKEKLKSIYHLPEKELKRYVKEVIISTEKPQEFFLLKLETRLDNIIYRLGLVSDRTQAQKLIRGGQIVVNGVKIDDPAYHLRQRDVIEFEEDGFPYQFLPKDKSLTVPAWLHKENGMARMKRFPHFHEVKRKDINLDYVIEYYSLV